MLLLDSGNPEFATAAAQKVLLRRHYGYAYSGLSSRLCPRAEHLLYIGIMAPVPRAGVAELVDAPDSKSGSPKGECRFEPDLRYLAKTRKPVHSGVGIRKASGSVRHPLPEAPRLGRAGSNVSHGGKGRLGSTQVSHVAVDKIHRAYEDRRPELGWRLFASPARTLSEDFQTFYATRWMPPSILSATNGYR
jgi:hypothetical protein